MEQGTIEQAASGELGREFEQGQWLLNSEVVLLLERLQNDRPEGAPELSTSFMTSLEYAKASSKFDNKAAVDNVRTHLERSLLVSIERVKAALPEEYFVEPNKHEETLDVLHRILRKLVQQESAGDLVDKTYQELAEDAVIEARNVLIEAVFSDHIEPAVRGFRTLLPELRLWSHEIAAMGNLVPDDTDEAITLIPTLKRFDEEQLAVVLRELERIRTNIS